MADGWIELFDVETDEAELLFVFDRFEPVYYGCGVFQLLEAGFFRDCAVDAVEDVFADFAYLGLRGVDESAGRFVCEVRLVSLKCYECVFVSCSVHSVVDANFRIVNGRCHFLRSLPFHLTVDAFYNGRYHCCSRGTMGENAKT